MQKKSRISHVAAWLKKEYKVQISKEWLTACFEWIVEEEVSGECSNFCANQEGDGG